MDNNTLNLTQTTKDLIEELAEIGVDKDTFKMVMSGLQTDKERASMIGLIIALEQENITLDNETVLKALVMVRHQENYLSSNND